MTILNFINVILTNDISSIENNYIFYIELISINYFTYKYEENYIIIFKT